MMERLCFLQGIIRQDYEIKIEALDAKIAFWELKAKMFPSGFPDGNILLCKKDCQMYKSVCIFFVFGQYNVEEYCKQCSHYNR